MLLCGGINIYFYSYIEIEFTDVMMLGKGILFHRRLLKLQQWIQATNYSTSTQQESIETVLRSEFSESFIHLRNLPQYCIVNELIFLFLLKAGGYTKEATTKLLSKNRFLHDISPRKMRKSFQALQKLHIQKRDIKTHPRLLLQSHYELINNFQRLQEVGFREVTAYRLAHARELMSQSVHFNQCFNFLPHRNILQNIFAVAKVPTDPIDQSAYDRDMKLELVHQKALRKYMLDRIGYSEADIDEIWHNYAILKSRSLQSIDKTTRLLESAYNTPMIDLPKPALTMNPEEIEGLLQMNTICGIDVRKIMTIATKCNVERLEKIQRICHSYNVPDYVLAFSPKLFCLNYDTLENRLNAISKLNGSNKFLQHVGIGRLILCMDRLRTYVNSKGLNFNTVLSDSFIE